MKTLATTTALLTAVVWTGADASARHDSSLVHPATAYRDAVQDFRRGVHRARYVDRYDRRLVDDLERASHHFRTSAHHPSDVHRLRYHWDELRSLHGRVEAALFGRGGYPRNPALNGTWGQVCGAMGELSRQLRSLGGDYRRSPRPGHDALRYGSPTRGTHGSSSRHPGVPADRSLGTPFGPDVSFRFDSRFGGGSSFGPGHDSRYRSARPPLPGAHGRGAAMSVLGALIERMLQ